MSDAEIVPAAPEEVATILDVIARAAADKSVDVDKLERLFALQERAVAEQKRTAYMAALARLQEGLPQIIKSGTIEDRGGGVRNRFAKLEDIDRVIRPMCAAEGFAFSFDSKPSAKDIEFSCTMSHREGHSETRTMTLPVDTGPGRNSVQSVGSTTSYARRYLLSMHLNLVTREEDDDGNGVGAEPVTAEQAEQLRSELASVGGSPERFLNWIAAESFEAIKAANFQRALRFIDEKRKAKR